MQKKWAVLKAPHDLEERNSKERNKGGLSKYVSQESYKLVRIAIFTIWVAERNVMNNGNLNEGYLV